MSVEAINSSLSANTATALWMERGYSRRGIGQRMLAAVPDLSLYTSAEQSIPGVPVLPFPEVDGLTDEQMTDKFNGMIAEHGIDTIWPQQTAQRDLSGLDCEVHVAASADTVRMLDDKMRFLEWLGDDPYNSDVTELIGVEAVAKEYARRAAAGREVCVKPPVGVSGHGYWRLTPTAARTFLHDPDKREVHPDIYFAALELQEKDAKPLRLMMMDWLPGPEVSVDVLCWRGIPLAHAARTKLDSIHELVQSEHKVTDHARQTAARLALHGIVGVQYRLAIDATWKILEINARPAGGSVYGEDAGFGLIAGWAKLVAGRSEPTDIPQHHGEVMLNIAKQARVVAA